MLLRFQKQSEITSFEELFELSCMTLRNAQGEKKTTVLGPVTARNPELIRENLDMLSFYSKRLSEQGWVVLEIPSFQEVVDELIQQLNITGYPYGILHEFTLPLIRSKCFSVIHFRENYSDSLSTTIEHDATLGVHIPIRYLP